MSLTKILPTGVWIELTAVRKLSAFLGCQNAQLMAVFSSWTVVQVDMGFDIACGLVGVEKSCTVKRSSSSDINYWGSGVYL
jgi:hypothetical protein